MNQDIFWITFFVLTVLHPIGDFVVGHRRRWRGEFWIVLNPLHWWWDSSRFRQHHKYAIEPSKQLEIETGLILESDELLIEQPFWFWLGIDQLAHVILNIIFAAFIAMLFK